MQKAKTLFEDRIKHYSTELELHKAAAASATHSNYNQESKEQMGSLQKVMS